MISNMEYRMYLVNNANKIISNNSNCSVNNKDGFINNIYNINKKASEAFKSLYDSLFNSHSDLKTNYLNNRLWKIN